MTKNETQEDNVEKSESTKEVANKDTQNTAESSQGSDIAQAIAEGFKRSKEDSFELRADEGVENRFSLVENKNGEVMLRDNTDGTLSKLQLESIEEKEASIQDQEVTEL